MVCLASWINGYSRVTFAGSSWPEWQWYKGEITLKWLCVAYDKKHASNVDGVLFCQGTIPPDIGLLSNLTHLRLSFNSFVGRLQRPELVHLHDNKLSGEMLEMHRVCRKYLPSLETVVSPPTWMDRRPVQSAPCDRSNSFDVSFFPVCLLIILC